jgi:hypothetical protein
MKRETRNGDHFLRFISVRQLPGLYDNSYQ